MAKKSIRDLDVKGRRVLMRADFNVPLEGSAVSDDTRIRAALPTIRLVLGGGGSLVIMSHLGRPGGKRNTEESLKPAADRLGELLGKDVGFAADCVSDEAVGKAAALKPGQVLVLENLRFHPEEEGKAKTPDGASDEDVAAAKRELKERQREFAKRLAALGDVYVNDAFGTAHRAHASIAVVTEFFDESVAGLLLEKEIDYLSNAVRDPERPFVAIIGGAKISGKIDVMMNLIGKVDTLIVGGGMVYTFMRAKGMQIGRSLVEEDRIDMARDTLQKIEGSRTTLLLPVDHVVANDFSAEAATKVVSDDAIENGWMGLDIGPESIERFVSAIAGARTIVWNGPMGCFEMAPFAAGTDAVAEAVAACGGVSIIGGGDTVSAVNRSGVADRITHISTGGGASLELLEGKELPGLAALSDK